MPVVKWLPSNIKAIGAGLRLPPRGEIVNLFAIAEKYGSEAPTNSLCRRNFEASRGGDKGLN